MRFVDDFALLERRRLGERGTAQLVFPYPSLSRHHKINAIKTLLSAIINMTAFIFFAVKGRAVWPLMILMATGSIVGGYGGARLAKRANPLLYLFVVAVDLLVSGWLFVRSF